MGTNLFLCRWSVFSQLISQIRTTHKLKLGRSIEFGVVEGQEVQHKPPVGEVAKGAESCSSKHRCAASAANLKLCKLIQVYVKQSLKAIEKAHK